MDDERIDDEEQPDQDLIQANLRMLVVMPATLTMIVIIMMVMMVMVVVLLTEERGNLHEL